MSLDEPGIQKLQTLIQNSFRIRANQSPIYVDTAGHLSRVGAPQHQIIFGRRGSGKSCLDLDRTFEDFDATRVYLSRMLNALGEQVGIGGVTEKCFNPDALFALTLASGGVPRDYLTIFTAAIQSAKDSGRPWLTPTDIYKSAHQNSYSAKLANLRDEADSDTVRLESLFQDIFRFCLFDKRKTAFLVSQAEAGEYPTEHELIKQLMDFRLIHIVEPETSAASGRPGRYEAYTLDAAAYMEPRKRNIETVKFWEKDENYRKVGIRESPIYHLSQAKKAIASGVQQQTEDVLAELDDEPNSPIVDDE